MNTITSIDIKNKKVLIRVDYNVPIVNSKILNDFRIKATFKTIDYCLSQDCSLILMSHLGRPSEDSNEFTLYPIVKYLEKKYSSFIHFSDDCISKKSIEISNNLLPREIHVLENLRFYNQELDNDEDFAQKLSNHADIYICDSFGTSHREHASNSKILKFFKIKAIGFLMMQEFKYLDNTKLFNNTSSIIIGGAKISTKLKMIINYLDIASNILIGGAMAFTLLKAKGFNVGSSLFEDSMISESKKILDVFESSKTNLILPLDIVCKNKLTKKITVKRIEDIKNDDIGLDIGPETTFDFVNCINKSNIIIWNGPMGMFEDLNFATGTQTISKAIANIDKQFISIIGGGDTVSAIESTQNISSFTHVSTGGGASLKLLSGDILEFQKSWRLYDK